MRASFGSVLIFRPLNVLLIALFQLATFYFLDFNRVSLDLINTDLWLMIGSLACIAAAGYALNDWVDKGTDQMNKPSKCYAVNWSPWAFWSSYIVLNGMGLYLGARLSSTIFIFLLVIAVALLLYSFLLQRIALVGNLIIAACTSFSIIEVFYVFKTLNFSMVLFFTIFAFLLTFIREIVKDYEDREGDAQAGYRTLPILLPGASGLVLVQSLLIFVTVIFAYLEWAWISQFFSGQFYYVFLGYQIICVLVPLLYLIVRVPQARIRKDYTEMSAILKYIMATGVGSMLLF